MPYIGTGRISLFFEEAGSCGIPVLLLHELGGSSESWREVIPLLATDRRVLAVDTRCAGRSEKPPGAFALADVADDLDELLRALNLEGPVDVIGAALGSLAGALLAIRHPATVRRLMMCAVAGMRGVAEASLADSFPASHPAQRAAYAPAQFLPREQRGCSEPVHGGAEDPLRRERDGEQLLLGMGGRGQLQPDGHAGAVAPDRQRDRAEVEVVDPDDSGRCGG
jgi:pimeloyl-ACP methyl ester carboxylesterase